jgi:hypothetical protein
MNDFGASATGNIVSAWAQIIGSSVTGLLIAVMVAAFFVGGVYYMWVSKSDAAKKKETKWFLVNAILILFVVVSIWGIVTFIQKAFLGTSNVTTIALPKIPVSSQTGSGPSSSGPSPLGGGSLSPSNTSSSDGGSISLDSQPNTNTSNNNIMTNTIYRKLGESCAANRGPYTVIRCNAGLVCVSSICVDPSSSGPSTLGGELV